MLAGIFIIVLFGSCDSNKKQAIAEEVAEDTITISGLPKKTNPNAAAAKILEEWPEYNALSNSFEQVYAIKTAEDLTLAVDDVFEKIKLLDESKFPKKFSTPQIRSRQKVLETFTLKLKAAILDKTDTQTPLVEMVEAYNSLKNQFNITVNNTLDTNLIFDE